MSCQPYALQPGAPPHEPREGSDMPQEPRITVRKDSNGNTMLASAQRSAIVQAVEDAFRMAHRAANDMESIWNQSRPGRHRKRQGAWLANARFVEWLGSGALTRRQIRVTRRRMHRIRRRLDNRRLHFVVVQHQSGRRSWGCTNGNNPTNAYMRAHRAAIFLCPNWFSNTQSRRAAIVIHEVVHQLPFGLPFGKPHFQATDPDTARTTARLHPRRARKSPENYERLYEQYF